MRFTRGAAIASVVVLALPAVAGAARFAVYGDTRDNPAIHANVVAQVAASHSAFALFTGDAAMHGDSAAEWAAFASVEAPLADAGLPIYAVRGNHDTGPLFLQHFTPLPPGTTGTETYYAFDALGLHFLGMDTEGNDAPDSPQYEFVKGDLAAHAGKAPIVVFLHRALYSSGHHGDDGRLDGNYASLFGAAHVLAVFQGHDHDYERSKPIDGVTYFVEGGGGAAQRPFEGAAPDWSATRALVYGYVLVDVTPTALDVQAFDENGNPVDRISLPLPVHALPVDAGPVMAAPKAAVPRPATPPPPALPAPLPDSTSAGGSAVASLILLGVSAAVGLLFWLWRRPKA